MDHTTSKKEKMLIGCENSASVLEILYQLWIGNDPACDEKVQLLYRQMGEVTAQLGMEERDCLSNIVAALCDAYSHRAFLDAARMGGTFAFEILAAQTGFPLT